MDSLSRHLTLKRSTLLALMVALAGLSPLVPVLHAESDNLNSDIGSVQVFVENEDGSPATQVPIYISDGRKNLHVVESDALGSIHLDLATGNYTISSAVTRPIADSVDRYISSTAQIVVVPEETTTVILTLHLGDDAISNLSLSTLKKIGLVDEVAKYLF